MRKHVLMQHSLARLTGEMASYPAGAEDIVTAEAASHAVQALESSSELAVDLEQDAMHAFRPRLCFIQVATDKDLFLFDALSPEVDPVLLAPLLGDPGRTKFFHAAVGDLQYLAQAGVRVRGLFDTHRAATLLGWAKVGLADLARERLGVELPKDHQQSDFSIRPLPPDMRSYIADDVRYLTEIGRQVREECRKADILEEVELDCARLADEATSRPEIGMEFRPKIARNLPPAQIALATSIANALHQRRLAWAEALDVPYGRVLSNAAIAAIAARPPTTIQELAKVQGVHGRLAREHGSEILTLLQDLAAKVKAGEIPLDESHALRPDRLMRKRDEALRKFRSEKAAERKVTPSVVLGNPLVAELAKRAPLTLEELSRVPYFGEKRLRLYGTPLIELLARIE